MKKYIKILHRAAIESLFPRTCPVCDEQVDEGALIHSDCIKKLSFVSGYRCSKCGKQVGAKSEVLCYDCAHYKKSYEYGAALLNYDDAAQRMMVGIKYKNRREHIEVLGRMTAVALRDTIYGMQPDYLVPIPVNESRRRERGYNQAELLAEVISRELDIPLCAEMLIRPKKTIAQKELNPEERLKNLEKAFLAGEIPSDAHHIVLVDDIYTTGSTIEACTRVLRDKNIEKIYYISVCIGREFA